MKHFLLSVFIFISINSFAQCWKIPSNCSQVSFTGNISAGFNGNTRINTDAVLVIKENSTFTNWHFLAFVANNTSSAILVEPTLKMGGKKIYSGGNIILNRVEMSGNDTIFSAGEIAIYNISGTGSNNVIKLAIGMPYVLIGSKSYKAGDIINGNIKVEQCGNTALPIREESFQVKPLGNGVYKVSFETNADDSNGFILWVNVDGIRKKIHVITPVLAQRLYSFNVTREQLEK